MALGGGDRALEHGKVGGPRRRNVAGLREQNRDVEPVGEAPGGLDRGLVAAVDQRNPFARHGDEGDGRHGLGRGGEKRRHLGACVFRLVRPAAVLADVGEAHALGGAALPRHLGEQGRFLRAADRHGGPGCRRPGGSGRARGGRAGRRSGARRRSPSRGRPRPAASCPRTSRRTRWGRAGSWRSCGRGRPRRSRRAFPPIYLELVQTTTPRRVAGSPPSCRRPRSRRAPLSTCRPPTRS